MSPGHSTVVGLFVCVYQRRIPKIPVQKQDSRSPSDLVYVGIGFGVSPIALGIGDWSYRYNGKENKEKQKYNTAHVKNET